MSEAPMFMYFPMRNRKEVVAKRIYNVDVKRGTWYIEVLISYVDEKGQNRQILVKEKTDISVTPNSGEKKSVQ